MCILQTRMVTDQDFQSTRLDLSFIQLFLYNLTKFHKIWSEHAMIYASLINEQKNQNGGFWYIFRTRFCRFLVKIYQNSPYLCRH